MPKARQTPPESDLERIRVIARRLLSRLDAAVEQEAASSAEQETWLQKQHERLFGAKHSLCDTLETLAGLLVKLEVKDEVPEVSVAMNAADVALVEGFVRKLRE